MTIATIQPDGQITLPAAWREKYGLHDGDRVSLVETENGLMIVPEVANDAIDDDDDLTPEEYVMLEARLAPYVVDGKFDPEKYAADAEIVDLAELAASFGISSEKTYRP